ncbi:TRAP transporter small permease [Xanthobacteraceae bacterium Astr-EGSB]|uniref:TRAP transporter small permease n=1 Tax=Astrobacterium formosum TaxID=3069710 RepID=UPI0027B389DB|nr:TRAP transporter small permease [Xanthobacteraceae bacterium Astr-EGSB]
MIRRLHHALDVVVLTIAVPMTVVMLACTVWQVVSRYFLGISTSFTDELARFLFIWVSLLGAAYVFGKRGHIAITGLIEFLPAGVRRITDTATALLVVIFSAVILGGGGFILVGKAVQLGQVSPAMLLPIGYVYSVIPVSGAVTAMYALLVVAELWTGQETKSTGVSLD